MLREQLYLAVRGAFGAPYIGLSPNIYNPREGHWNKERHDTELLQGGCKAAICAAC